MLIKKLEAWDESRLTPTAESVYRSRRQILQGLGLVATGALSRGSIPAVPRRQQQPRNNGPDAQRNPAYTLDRPLTLEALVTTNNIFDEFGSDRSEIWKAAADFQTAPWKVHIGGDVDRALTVDVEDLVRRFGVEERVYRHRCVETWSMAVPWIGFPLRRLIELAKPRSTARFVRMVSFSSPDEAPGWYATRRVFPYYEALTLEEATSDLAFLVTGLYGKPLPPQNGAPIRLAVPWKYGYKSLKSIVAFQFTRERPGTFWSDLAPHLYSWQANVDPTSTEPWSQATETMLGTSDKRPTLPLNGYAEQVATLYR